jgi:hypothetical protein
VPERGKDWLAQAERDLEVAKANAKAGSYEWACLCSPAGSRKGGKIALSSLTHGRQGAFDKPAFVYICPVINAPMMS